jgi:hypothetical protein
MEFAVSAILLLVLLLPGFILQSAYTKGFWRWNSPTSTRSLTEQVPAAVVLSPLLHGVWSAASARFGVPIDLQAVAMLLLGNYGHEDARFDAAISAVTNHPYRILSYFASLYIVSACLGYFSHFLVRKTRLDRTTRVLRFNNQWYYLLTGEITEFKESRSNSVAVSGVWLMTVVHHEKEDWLYIGYIQDFFFDKSGDLDRVLLTDVARRKFAEDLAPEDPADDERYYEIEGDYFLLRYSEMSTINLDYIFVSKQEESEPLE